jgi:toxin secretion/phage lysis holin
MNELLKLHFTSQIWIVILPLILMVIDIITGYYNAWKNDEISSQKMRDGIGKKIAEICYIVLGIMFGIAFGIQAISYFISIYIIYMELMSVAENCKKLGLPVPSELEKKLNNNENIEKINDNTEEELSNGGEEDEIESNK